MILAPPSICGKFHTSLIQLMLNIEWVSDYILTSTFKVKVGLTPVHCGHTCVQAGWTDVCPPWTLSCPTWFFSVILSQKEMIFLKDISQHNWSFNSLIFGNFIFSNFSNIYSGVGQTPVQPGQACVRWTIGCPCQGSQYWDISFHGHTQTVCVVIYLLYRFWLS